MSKLIENGYQVQRNQMVYRQSQVDILAERGGERQAIEIALPSEKILDSISHLSQMRRFPNIDTTYVAILKQNLNEDVSFFAQRLGVGIIAVTSSGIEYGNPPPRAGANISVNASLPNSVGVGSRFDFSMTLGNVGEKILTQVETKYFPSYPFEPPKDASSVHMIDELQSGESKTLLFSVTTDSGAKAGSYPLLIKVSSYGLTPFRNTFFIRVD